MHAPAKSTIGARDDVLATQLAYVPDQSYIWVATVFFGARDACVHCVPNHIAWLSRATLIAPTTDCELPVRTSAFCAMNCDACFDMRLASLKEPVYATFTVVDLFAAFAPATKPSTYSFASPTAIGQL